MQKENKPVISGGEVLPVGKMTSQMAAQTPQRRRPLGDIQTPCRNSVDASKPVITPLQTPKQKKTHRKPRRSSLLGNCKENVTQETLMSVSRKIGEIKEEQVDLLVSQVLDTCVSSLTKEITENPPAVSQTTENPQSVLKDVTVAYTCKVIEGVTDINSVVADADNSYAVRREDALNDQSFTLNDEALEIFHSNARDGVAEDRKKNLSHCEENSSEDKTNLMNKQENCNKEENNCTKNMVNELENSTEETIELDCNMEFVERQGSSSRDSITDNHEIGHGVIQQPIHEKCTTGNLGTAGDLEADCESRCDADSGKAERVVSERGDINVAASDIEENLLADTSLYSSCHESFMDSISEEALLASFKETSDPSSSVTSGSTGSDSVTSEQNPMLTPMPDFFKRVALCERVKQAQSSLAECVFPKETMLKPLQWVYIDQMRKQTHDMACSPIPNSSRICPEVHKSLSFDLCEHSGRQCSESDISDGVSIANFSAANNLTSSTPVSQVAGNSSLMDGANSDSGIAVAANDSEAAIIVCATSPVVLPETRNISSAVGYHSCGCSPIIARTHEAAVATDVNCVNDISMMTDPQTPPRKVVSSSSSVSCSPFPIPICHTAIQNVPETQSVFCSPIPVPVQDSSIQNCASVQDISIQNVAETQSVMCSPMTVPVHDISIQYNPAMQSMMCSPMAFPANDVSIQYEAHTQSVMCSPIPVPVHNVSIQNAVETQSVLCSPMVPRPCLDKSVLAGALLVDCASGPDGSQQDDAGIQVQPDMQTTATEMNESPMVNVSTSMTPLKQGKKKVERFTADDVRRQHPRVLANTVDTLQIQNSRLEAKVVALERDHNKVVKLEDKVKHLEAEGNAFATERDECRAALATERDQSRENMQHWQAENERLRHDLELATQDHQAQISQLKDDYERQDFHDQFLASQKLVRQMQCELDQYKQLAPDLEQTHTKQNKLMSAVTSSYTKVKAAGEQLLAFKSRLDIQERELAEQQADCHAELHVLTEDRTQLERDRAEMVQIVAMCKENVIKLDSDLECSSTELMEAQSRVASLETQLVAARADCEELRTEKEALVRETADLRDEGDHLRTQLTHHEQLKEQLEELTHRMTDTEEKHSKEVARFKDSLTKKYLETVNLQRTLDMREADIDTLETDLFECRETIDKQVDSMGEIEGREKVLTSELLRVTEENNTLKNCCAALRAKEQELRGTLDNTLEELEGTKGHATRIIKQQGTEIAECSVTIGQLSHHMTSVLDKLKGKAGIQDETADGETSINTQAPHASLVSQILDAVKSSAAETEGGSEKSCEIQPVKETDDDIVVSCVEVSDKLDASAVRKPDSFPNLGLSVTTGDFVDEVGELVQGEGLAGQMTAMTTVFSEVVYVADVIQKALRASLYDLQSENYELNLRTSQCEHSERRVQAEMEYRDSELEKSERQNKQLKEKLEEITDRFGVMVEHEAEIKHLHEEIGGLRIKLGQKQAERDLLSSQVDQLVQRLDSVSSGQQDPSKVNRDLQYEVLQLQKKVERYRSELTQRESAISDLSAKAARRMKVLETNWKKADKEVCRLDELVDTIYEVLMRNGNAAKDNELQRLVRLINGGEQTGNVKL